ncbi:hypothetical protein [Amycolatopsis sp. NPDC004378]
MSDGKAAEFVHLWQKVKAAEIGLTEKEKGLVLACLKNAWASIVEEEDLEKGFQGSFTPEQADLILHYASASASIRSLTHLYPAHSIRSFHANSIRS